MDIYAVARELSEITEHDSLMRKIADNELENIVIMVDGDPDDVENFLFSLIDLTHNSAEELESWLEKKASASDVVESLAEFLEDLEFNGEEVNVKAPALKVEIENLVNLVSQAKQFVDSNPELPGTISPDFYVYVHVNEETGKVFYVGKGKGNRGWSKNRESYWLKHVESLDRRYSVKIVAKGLSESEALKQEEALLIKHSKSVINRNVPVGMSIKMQTPLE